MIKCLCSTSIMVGIYSAEEFSGGLIQSKSIIIDLLYCFDEKDYLTYSYFFGCIICLFGTIH